MSPPNGRAGAVITPALTNRIATRPSKDSRATQYDRVLGLLLDYEEVCGSVFYRAYIPRFSVWIHRLRRQGYLVSKRKCDRVAHGHIDTQWMYRLEALPEELL